MYGDTKTYRIFQFHIGGNRNINIEYLPNSKVTFVPAFKEQGRTFTTSFEAKQQIPRQV